MIIDLVVGARPNFVKAAAIIHAAKKYPSVKINLLHTGQHTQMMSDPFFEELGLPVPKHKGALLEFELNMTPLEKLCRMVVVLGRWFEKDKPDCVMVVGDTDSTLAGALAAAKLVISLIHVEAGLRCGDMAMQEEINRILVDSVSGICYTTTSEARDTLLAEGHNPSSVKFVGNVIVGMLYRFLPVVERTHFQTPYAILTLHRAENVDHDDVIFPMLDAVRRVAERIPVIWPAHPRTRSRIGAWKHNGQFSVIDPLGYLDFISLLSSAKFVMTDSGGLQEEATALGIPCLTLRKNTERPETVWSGSNWVVGTDPESIVLTALSLVRRREPLVYSIPELWDGHAADRIMVDLVGRSA